jgi:hypothetical protein
MHTVIDADVGYEPQTHVDKGADSLITLILTMKAEAVEEVGPEPEHPVEAELHGSSFARMGDGTNEGQGKERENEAAGKQGAVF